jgi:hypothetical protein
LDIAIGHNLAEEIMLITYTQRWTIEIFFRDNKMQLELDRYQICTKQAMMRFLCIIMIAVPLVAV